MRHRIKHHVNRPVLHMGLFTDGQMLPGAGLFTLAAGWLYSGGGGIASRVVIAGILLLPVGVMVVDNRVGGIVTDRVSAFVRWHREPGIYVPGADEASGYELSIDEQDAVVLEREQLAHADLDIAFAQDT